MYTLTLTEKQAQVLSTACEVLARLGIGQFRDALEHLPVDPQYPEGWHDTMGRIGALLSPMMIGQVDGWGSSLGIYHDRVRDDAKIAWSLYSVIRHRLAWDRAIERGDTDGTKRNWLKMMTVNFDEPMLVGSQPLARIARADGPPVTAVAEKGEQK